MIFGPEPPRGIPKQDAAKVQLIAERWVRAQAAIEPWAKKAKECVEFLEGKQWTETQLKKLAQEGRPALVFNRIAPLVRLILGYHRNNRVDTTFLPGQDGTGDELTAEALSQLFKQFATQTNLEFVDAEVFMDGLTTGRGFFDHRLDFSESDFGELKARAVDPFSVYIDPDAEDYDLSKGANYIQTSRWASIDEIEQTMGKRAARMVGSIFRGEGSSQFPSSIYAVNEEITPVRRFGSESSDIIESFPMFQERWVDFIDTYRKNIRLIDTQYKVREVRNVFVDLETGDWEMIPEHWDREKIAKVMFHAERVGNPLRIVRRPVERIRWTVLAGDVMIFDDWSPYERYTIDGYFPYFRRGQTRGMLHDLIDPQREINKRRSAEIDIVSRTTNSGWLHHENALDAVEEAKLDEFGSSPGIRIKWKGEPSNKPERINPSPPPTSMERLERSAQEDLKQISGVNDSLLGQLDRVQSGRAIEARQRQAVISIQMYMDNFSRTKKQCGMKFLSVVQRHYTEQRIIRILGEDGRLVQAAINQPIMGNDGTTIIGKLNDVTLGKYSVVIDEQPMSASFRNAQFEEALDLLEKVGPFIADAAPALADIVIDMSSMPRKEEFKSRIKQALQGATALGGGGIPLPAGAGPARGNAPSLDQASRPGGNVVPISAATAPAG